MFDVNLMSLMTLGTGVEAALIIGSIVGAGASVVQNVRQSKAARDNARRQSSLNELEAQRFKLQTSKQRAAARAKFGAAGVDIEGSPLEVLGAAVSQEEQDLELIGLGGRLQVEQQLQLADEANIRSGVALVTGAVNIGTTLATRNKPLNPVRPSGSSPVINRPASTTPTITTPSSNIFDSFTSTTLA